MAALPAEDSRGCLAWRSRGSCPHPSSNLAWTYLCTHSSPPRRLLHMHVPPPAFAFEPPFSWNATPDLSLASAAISSFPRLYPLQNQQLLCHHSPGPELAPCWVPTPRASLARFRLNEGILCLVIVVCILSSSRVLGRWWLRFRVRASPLLAPGLA